MKRKLKSTQGETLVEVLASILIGALSVALLFTAVMASARMDKTAKETDSKYKDVLVKAEGRTAVTDTTIVPSGSKVTVKGKDASGTEKTAEITVTFYGGDGALSYALAP